MIRPPTENVQHQPPSAAVRKNFLEEQHDRPRIHFRSLWVVLALGLIVGGCVILYQAAYASTYTIDSYFYLSKAKQMAGGHGLRTTWNDGFDAKYFPGYSIFLALSFLLGGSYVHVQLFSYLLCGLLLFRIAKELELGPAEQLLATSALIANPIALKWYSLPMAEGAALALALLSAFVFLRFSRTKRYPLLFTACMIGGIAAVTRPEAVFLLLVFALIVLSERGSMLRPGMLARLIAGVFLFVLPLLVYWLRLRASVAGGSAYFDELIHSFLRFDLLKNFAYNIWVPFGFMHKPFALQGAGASVFVTMLAGAIWLIIGGIFFFGGLIYSLLGRLGPRVKGAGVLFLLYALLHAFWYYRYERFMLMAVPLAAIVWSAAAGAFIAFLRGKKGHLRFLILAQLLIVAAGLYLGNHYSTRHRKALAEDAGGLQFRHIASVVNELNAGSRAAVLTDLGPHLAYYLEAHAYMDEGHGNYWQRAFPPERTLEEMNRLGIGFVVTGKKFGQWLADHKISAEDRPGFKESGQQVEGSTIIKYAP